MVVPVLIVSCHVSEKWNSGPAATHTTTASAASENACVLPAQRVATVEMCSSALIGGLRRFAMRRMIAVTDRPRIGISACLLGERVRYDGGDKRNAWLADELGRHVEWVPVCPEVEAGFGTPREPMKLVRSGGLVDVTTTRARPDLTEQLRSVSIRRVDELAVAGLDGYVLKAGSPSCAIESTGDVDGPGLFAEMLMRRLPELPIVDDQRLADEGERRRFVERVFAHHATGKIVR